MLSQPVIQSSLSRQLREGGGKARDSAPFAGEVTVSASQSFPRIRHSRLSQRVIFGVSFLLERILVSTEVEGGALVGPVERYTLQQQLRTFSYSVSDYDAGQLR